MTWLIFSSPLRLRSMLLLDSLVSLNILPLAQTGLTSIIPDGTADPYGPVAKIVAALKVAAEASAEVDISTPFTTVEIGLCVEVIVKIIIVRSHIFPPFLRLVPHQ